MHIDYHKAQQQACMSWANKVSAHIRFNCHKSTHMMFEAITALLSFPRVISQRLRRSRMTVTRKRFSCSSNMLPDMLPIAQHSVLSAAHVDSLPLDPPPTSLA